MVSSRVGDHVIVRLLLQQGATVLARDAERHTALWYACKYEQRAVAMLLRQAREAAKQRLRKASKEASADKGAQSLEHFQLTPPTHNVMTPPRPAAGEV